MRLKSFKAKNIHGHQSPNVRFYNDITFLTGINGSGKTTIVNCIVALIQPSFRMLANTEFDYIEVAFVHESRHFSIFAIREHEAISLGTNMSKTSLQVPYAFSDDNPRHVREHEAEFYDDFYARNAEHEVIRALGNLPTPMFLNLDRRAEGHHAKEAYGNWKGGPIRRRARNVFSPHLSQSLARASTLASDAYTETMFRVSQLGEDLRREIALDTFSVEPLAEPGYPIEKPTPQDLRAISEMKDAVGNISDLIGVPKREVSQRLLPFLEHMEKIASKIPRNMTDREIRRKSDEGMYNMFLWSANKMQLDRIRQLIQKIRDYNHKVEFEKEHIERYRNIVNRFLEDSGKEIVFSRSAELAIRIKKVREDRSIYSLSSGEAQIVVILSHLAFNPIAREANIFLIDEPELSLHVQWQTNFVDALREINSQVQLIFATHSPGIIRDRLDKCIDLNVYR